jgi:hypothetical protein
MFMNMGTWMLTSSTNEIMCSDPKKPGTLHYTGSGANEYQQAIAQIGTIVSPYDVDQKFPVSTRQFCFILSSV